MIAFHECEFFFSLYNAIYVYLYFIIEICVFVLVCLIFFLLMPVVCTSVSDCLD